MKLAPRSTALKYPEKFSLNQAGDYSRTASRDTKGVIEIMVSSRGRHSTSSLYQTSLSVGEDVATGRRGRCRRMEAKEDDDIVI